MASAPQVGGQSALEIAAITARNKAIASNIYDNVEEANEYSATHTRALGDKETPKYGKGTGNYLDVDNYDAGSSIDINGDQSAPNGLGSGRLPALALNASEWGFGPPALGMQTYTAPDMSKNEGQVII